MKVKRAIRIHRMTLDRLKERLAEQDVTMSEFLRHIISEIRKNGDPGFSGMRKKRNARIEGYVDGNTLDVSSEAIRNGIIKYLN